MLAGLADRTSASLERGRLAFNEALKTSGKANQTLDKSVLQAAHNSLSREEKAVRRASEDVRKKRRESMVVR